MFILKIISKYKINELAFILLFTVAKRESHRFLDWESNTKFNVVTQEAKNQMESELKRVIQKQAKATLESCSYGNTSQSIRSFLTQQKAGGRNEFDFDWDQDQSFSDLHNVSQDPEVVNNKTKLKKNINPFGISSKVRNLYFNYSKKLCRNGLMRKYSQNIDRMEKNIGIYLRMWSYRQEGVFLENRLLWILKIGTNIIWIYLAKVRANLLLLNCFNTKSILFTSFV